MLPFKGVPWQRQIKLKRENLLNKIETKFLDLEVNIIIV